MKDCNTMKKSFEKKSASAVSIIGGADGPTAVFTAGSGKRKKSLRQIIESRRYARRKNQIIKGLKADPHTMNQVVNYARKKWGFSIVSKESSEYRSQYKELRAQFLVQYKPELLGDLAEFPELADHDEASIRKFIDLVNQRQAAAEAIPADLFDIDLCVLKKCSGKSESILLIENRYKCISGSSYGTKKEMNQFDKAYRDIYNYYGVTQKDIDEQTDRYHTLVNTLAQRQ